MEPITCDFCDGKGWKPPSSKDSFPKPCTCCGGAGRLTFAEVCWRICELQETVKNLVKFRYRGRRARIKVATRILDKLLDLAAMKPMVIPDTDDVADCEES